VPALFILSSLVLVANTLAEKPVESLIGVFLLALGGPRLLHLAKAGKVQI
jgi:hypothetical protein